MRPLRRTPAKNDAKSAVLSTETGASGVPRRVIKRVNDRARAARIVEPGDSQVDSRRTPRALRRKNAHGRRRDDDGLPVRRAAQFDRDRDRPRRRAGLERHRRKVAETHLSCRPPRS